MSEGNGKPKPDQHTQSAREMVAINLAQSASIRRFVHAAQLSPRPMDATPLILDAIGAQGRTLAFILDEMLASRGEYRSIVFKDESEKKKCGAPISGILGAACNDPVEDGSIRCARHNMALVVASS